MAREDGFLARWSRRKRAAALPDAPAPPDVGARRDGDTRERALATLPADLPAAEAAREESGEEAFDIATLPPVETLTDQSDIRDFLRKGVPESLKNAALRKVWAADPFLRTFTGPGEYAWDFNDPDSIPGFSSAAPDFDLVEHARLVTGHAPPAPAPGSGPARAPAADFGQDIPERLLQGGPLQARAHDDAGVEAAGTGVEGIENAAPQEKNINAAVPNEEELSEPFQEVEKRRRHGGAVPD